MPLGGKIGASELLAHATVARVARECGKTAAQVLLRWNLQHGCALITRASAAHAGNGALGFTLGAEHMRLLDGMSAAAGTKRFLSAGRVTWMRKPGAAYSW
jgi:diketogulonate reductase-like aldo/keto reductase